MPSLQNTEKLRKKAGSALREVREGAGKERIDLARLCGMTGSTGIQTIGTWELGIHVPRKDRRRTFIQFLWNECRLKRDEEHQRLFKETWEAFVEGWNWDELGEDWDDLLAGKFQFIIENSVPTEEPIIILPVPPETPAINQKFTPIIFVGALATILVVFIVYFSIKPHSSPTDVSPGQISTDTPINAPFSFALTPEHCYRANADASKKIVIAQFVETGEDLNYENYLQDSLVTNIEPEWEICRSSQKIENATLAQTFGESIGATVVVWGRRDASSFVTGVEIMDWPAGTFIQHIWSADDAQSNEFDAKVFPSLAELMVNNALSYLDESTDKLAKARNRLDRALAMIEQNQEIVSTNQKLVASAYFSLGNFWEKATSSVPADNQKAVSAFERGLELDPDEVGYLLNIGQAYKASGDAAKAESFYAELIRSDRLSNQPKLLGTVYWNLALWLEDKGEYEQAEKNIQSAISLSPDTIQYYRELGLLQLHIGKPSEAKTTYHLAHCWIVKSKEEDVVTQTINNMVNELKGFSESHPTSKTAIQEIITELGVDDELVDC